MVLNQWDREVIVTPLNQEGGTLGSAQCHFSVTARMDRGERKLRGIAARVREVHAMEQDALFGHSN